MVAALLLVVGLLPGSSDGGESPAGPADRSAYEAARAGVGRAPGADVTLALWCEAHGLQAERMKHLARAVLADPSNALARGLMGLVAYQGQWKRPEAVAKKVQADGELTARLAEYNARRARAAATADAQWSLALWCEQNGLAAEALAHFTAVTRLDPSREAAWKRLGCKKVNGRWLTEADIAAEKDEAELQKKADRHWKPLLTKWRGMLNDKQKRAAAEQAMLGVSDPRAVPMVWSVLVAAGPAQHDLAVRVLGQIDAASSSRALAFLAVFDDSAEVRRAATETLRRRDPREFAGLIVGLLQKPIKYQVRPVGGPGSPGALFVEGQRFNVQRMYAPPALPNLNLPAGMIQTGPDGLPVYVEDRLSVYTRETNQGQLLSFQQFAAFNPTDPALAAAAASYRANEPALWHNFWLGRPHNKLLLHNNRARELANLGVSIFTGQTTTNSYLTETVVPVGQIALEYQKSALAAQQQLSRDVTSVDAYNDQVKLWNERVAQVLGNIANVSYGDDQKAWNTWYVNLQGYAYTPPPDKPVPTVVENVPLDYTPSFVPSTTTTRHVGSTVVEKQPSVVPGSSQPSCFGAGTLVRTLDGSRAIESIKVGDRVLTQDVKSGALDYHPVTVVHHNPPSPTFLVKVGGDTIVSSPFHRFWIVGTGWKMARDLKGGETLRLLDGPARVDSVNEGPVQLVYNLDVAGAHDFFAGSAAALVHDNTLPDTRLVAFDAAAVIPLEAH